MDTHVYDPADLNKFARDTDVYGFQQLTSPPRDIKKADQVRREPRAAIQWILAVLTQVLSATIGMSAAFLYATVFASGGKTITYQDYASTFKLGDVSKAVELCFMLGFGALSAAIMYWVFVRFTAKRPVYEIIGPGWLKEFALGLLLGTVLICIIIAVLFGMGHYKIEGTQLTKGFLLAIFIGIGPAFTEEVIFRGFALRLLDKAVGSLPAIVITSLVFGLMHAGNKYVSLTQSILLGISAGLLLGSCYYLTRRLWLAMGLHLSWNFVQGGIFNSDISGNGFTGGLLKGSFSGPEYLTGGKMGIEGSVISIGLTIAVGIILMVVAYKRGNLNRRIGWNAQRINLLGSVPRLEIWAANGGWRPLPTAEELDYYMRNEEENDLSVLPGEASSGESLTAITNEPPAVEPTIKAADTSDVISEPSGDPFDTDTPDELDALLPPEDASLTGELPVADKADEEADKADEEAVSPEDKTEQFAPVTLDSEPTIKPKEAKEHPDWPSDAEMEAVTVKTPDGPPTITKVSSSVTTVKGTGTGSLTDDDLDSTQQMDAVAEIDQTDQIKPIEQTKITEEHDES